MEKLPVSPNIRQYTTQEVLQNQVKDFVLQLMDAGKASRKNGWVMSDIVAEVHDAYGRDMAVFARDYIVKDICGVQA